VLGLTRNDDATLVRRARAGDRAAFARLVDRHRPLVLALCRRMAGPTPLAEDAAQEAVVQALLHLDRLRRPERFGPWLAGIGLNICRLWLRERARGPESWEALVGGWLAPELADAGPDPAELAAAAELAARVRAAVMALPPAQRAAVLLHYLAGLTQAEVAATLGVAPDAVKARLHRARRALRDQLLTLWTEETMAPEAKAGPVEMRVLDVRVVQHKEADDEEAGPRWVVLLEQVGGERLLPIWVGQSDAEALMIQLEGIAVPRPQSHDLTASILKATHVRLREVVVERIVDDVFFATVVLDGPDGPGRADARPSDALNLALRVGAPIRVQPDLLAAVGVDRAAAEAGTPSDRSGRRAALAITLRERHAEQAFLAALGRERVARLPPLPAGVRRVLGAAREEALMRGHPAVDQTHLLLGIASVPGTAGLRVLAAVGVTRERLRSELEVALSSAEPSETGGEIALTPSAVASLELAADDARDAGHGYLGVGHLLLGILREGQGRGYRLLDRLGVGLDPVRAAWQRHLRAGGH
jgi:RNA polymerase sigma-70 factor (ECF subfamily)